MHGARRARVLDCSATTNAARLLSAASHASVGAGGVSVGKDSRDIIRELEADGWYFVGATGSHHHFKHPGKPGKVTVPHPRRDLHPKTVRSIYRQAGLQEQR